MTKTLTQMTDLGEEIRIRYENFIDLVRILKVKYIRTKESVQASKVTILKKMAPTREVEELIDDMGYYDENRNQILVNL